MTYGEIAALPDGASVRLLSGRLGRIVAWHHTDESVSVRVDEDGAITLRAAELRRTADGVVEQVVSDPS